MSNLGKALKKKKKMSKQDKYLAIVDGENKAYQKAKKKPNAYTKSQWRTMRDLKREMEDAGYND